MTDKAQEFIDNFLSHEYDPVKAHEYYMRTRELKGRSSRSGDDSRKQVKLPPRDQKTYKELRGRLGSLIRRTKHITIEMYKLFDSPTYTPKQKARMKELERQIEPFIPEIQKLDRDIKRSGFAKEFEKYDRFIPNVGRANSANPRGVRR